MRHKASLNQLKVSYLMSVVVIVTLLTITQVIIQSTLLEGQRERSVASQMNQQELRTQRMFYNVLLLQNPTGHGVDYMGIYREVKADEQVWERVQNAMYVEDPGLDLGPGDFSATALGYSTKEKPGFLQMEAAYHRIFAQEELHHPASPDLVRVDVSLIYLEEAPYLQSIISIYNDVTTEANGRVNSVQIAEIFLYTLSLLTVLAEGFLVARPAWDNTKNAFAKLQEMIEKVEGGNKA